MEQNTKIEEPQERPVYVPVSIRMITLQMDHSILAGSEPTEMEEENVF